MRRSMPIRSLIIVQTAIVTALDDDYADTDDDTDVDAHHEDLIAQTAIEIEAYVRDGQAYLDPHLKIDDVVEHCRRDARQLCRA